MALKIAAVELMIFQGEQQHPTEEENFWVQVMHGSPSAPD